MPFVPHAPQQPVMEHPPILPVGNRQGRVMQRVEPTPSKVTFETRQDPTDEAKLTTAIENLSIFLQKMIHTSDIASMKRKEKEAKRRCDESLPPRQQMPTRVSDPGTGSQP
eukprot:Lankesteria_metandrocarpae@DN11021_c0_g1_i1.p1